MSFHRISHGPHFGATPGRGRLITTLSLPLFMLLWGALQREALPTLAGALACLTAICWDQARPAGHSARYCALLAAAAAAGSAIFFAVMWLHANRTLADLRW